MGRSGERLILCAHCPVFSTRWGVYETGGRLGCLHIPQAGCLSPRTAVALNLDELAGADFGVLGDHLRRELGGVEQGEADAAALEDLLELAEFVPAEVAGKAAVNVVRALDVFILREERAHF